MTDTEMTRFLAEKCMGWTVSLTQFGQTWASDGAGHNRLIDGEPHASYQVVWNPPSSISDALMLVPPMREKGFSFSLQTSMAHNPDATKAAFSHSEKGEDFVRVDAEICRSICLAAIAALEGK